MKDSATSWSVFFIFLDDWGILSSRNQAIFLFKIDENENEKVSTKEVGKGLSG
jgi:hypothetical protein